MSRVTIEPRVTTIRASKLTAIFTDTYIRWVKPGDWILMDEATGQIVVCRKTVKKTAYESLRRKIREDVRSRRAAESPKGEGG